MIDNRLDELKTSLESKYLARDEYNKTIGDSEG